MIKIVILMLAMAMLNGCASLGQSNVREACEGRVDPSSITNQKQYSRQFEDCTILASASHSTEYIATSGDVIKRTQEVFDRCMIGSGYKIKQ